MYRIDPAVFNASALAAWFATSARESGLPCDRFSTSPYVEPRAEGEKAEIDRTVTIIFAIAKEFGVLELDVYEGHLTLRLVDVRGLIPVDRAQRLAMYLARLRPLYADLLAPALLDPARARDGMVLALFWGRALEPAREATAPPPLQEEY